MNKEFHTENDGMNENIVNDESNKAANDRPNNDNKPFYSYDSYNSYMKNADNSNSYSYYSTGDKEKNTLTQADTYEHKVSNDSSLGKDMVPVIISTPYSSPYTPSQPEEMPKVRKRKKSKMFGFFKLTAAAIAFGLIAGAVFQGYNVLTTPKTEQKVEEEDKSNPVKITETVANSKDTVNPVTNSSDSIATDVSDVVEKVMPSIVAINSSATVTTYDFFGRQFTQPQEGSGSGIIIAQNGSKILIATNNHVIEGADEVEIVFMDDTTAQAEVKGADSKADLAVLSVDLSDLSEATASAIKVAVLGNSDETKPGEMAIAIGNALGYGQSVTVGYISAVNRKVTIEDQEMTLLQTDAAINPGNSGGALLNASGQVIGINSVKFASSAIEGMGYAIPISRALPIINDLMNREIVADGEQGFLGIDASTAQNVTELYSKRFNMPIGVYINDVISGSPAEEAGLMQGNIITGIDTSKIETIDDLVEVLRYKKAGQTIDLIIQVKENGEYVEKVLKVTLGEKK